MKKEIVLYEKLDSNSGCLTFLVSLAILIIMGFVDDKHMNSANEDQLILLTILLPIIGGIFFFMLMSINKEKPRELLSISEIGINHHFKASQITWDKISEIQIIDNVISVTVDSEPEKDFKLALNTTDFYERQMTIDNFVKFINCYYKKNIYTYNSPPSCGCC